MGASGIFSFWHIVMILAVVVLVFGTRKLANVGADLGAAIKGFKQAMQSDVESAEETTRAADAKLRLPEAEPPGAAAPSQHHG